MDSSTQPDINYAYEYGVMTAKNEALLEKIDSIKRLMFNYALKNPRNKALQSLIDDCGFKNEYRIYSLPHKMKGIKNGKIQTTY